MTVLLLIVSFVAGVLLAFMFHAPMRKELAKFREANETRIAASRAEADKKIRDLASEVRGKASGKT